jgi:hypothetical protein
MASAARATDASSAAAVTGWIPGGWTGSFISVAPRNQWRDS